MITFADAPLVVEDPGGKIQAWFDQYLALEELHDQNQTTSLVSQRANSRSGYRSQVSLPRPNYPTPDRIKLNTLYWPTGASRWAKFYGLATTAQYEAIIEQIGSNSASQAFDLVLSDGANEITTSMYLLQPRKISTVQPAEPLEALWLLPLVDARYYWQFVDTQQFRYGTGNEFQDWNGVFTTLSSRLGVTISKDSIAAAYGVPDADEMTRSYENIAVLLDSVCHSIGQRLVRQLDGTVESLAWSTSDTDYDDNLELENVIIGGSFGDKNAGSIVPEKLRVVFPKWYYGAPDPYGGLYNSDKSASDYTDVSPAKGMVKTIHTTAFADFSTGSTLPDNATELGDLADQIATDFYASLGTQYDVTFAGIANWKVNGYDDCIEWCMGRKANLPQYQAFTRARAMAYNFGVEEQLSQFKDTPVYPSLTRFQLNATLSPGGNATGFHYKFSSGSYSVTTDKIKVYDFENKFSGQSGTQGWAQFKGDSLRWEVVDMQPTAYVWVTVGADVTFGGSATGTVIHYAGANPGATITAYPDDTYDGSTIKNGKKCRCSYDAAAKKWWIVGAQC